MQGGGDPQTGGFLDPGTAALIAAILSGGVGFYGYSKTGSNKEEEIASRIEGRLEEAQKALLEKGRKYDKLMQEKDAAVRNAERLKRETETLKTEAKNQVKTAQANAQPAVAFKNASPDVLKAAIPLMLASLKNLATQKPEYAWMKDSNLANVAEQLEYPAGYSGRLARLSLPDLYDKRIFPAAQQDKEAAAAPTGGRRRRYRRKARGGAPTREEKAFANYQSLVETVNVDPSRKDELAAARDELLQYPGGQDEVNRREGLLTGGPSAPAATESEGVVAVVASSPSVSSTPSFFPSYEEFAQLYLTALQNKSITVRQQLIKKQKDALTKKEQEKTVAQQKKDEDKKNKDNATAVKASGELAIKFNKALKESESTLAPYKYLTKVLSPGRKKGLVPYAKRLVEVTAEALKFIPKESQATIPEKSRLREWYEAAGSVLTIASEFALMSLLVASAAASPSISTGIRSNTLGAIGGGGGDPEEEESEEEQEGGLSLFGSKPPPPASTTPLESVPMAWNKVQTLVDWNEVKPKAQTLLDEYNAAVKAFVDAAKAAKEAEKKGVSIAAPTFGLPTLDLSRISSSNPFAGVLATMKEKYAALSSSISEAEKERMVANDLRALTKEAVDVIRSAVDQADKAMKEIDSLQSTQATLDENEKYLASRANASAQEGFPSSSTQSEETTEGPAEEDEPEVINGGRRRRRRRGGVTPPVVTVDDTGPSIPEGYEQDPELEAQCKSVRAAAKEAKNELDWFKKQLSAILYANGEGTRTKGTSAQTQDGTEWVYSSITNDEAAALFSSGQVTSEAPTDTTLQSSETAAVPFLLNPSAGSKFKVPALKYLLSRLSTGVVGKTADFFKARVGIASSYTVADVALAGEAYVVLRCYLDALRGPLAVQTGQFSRAQRLGIQTRRIGQKAAEGTRKIARNLKEGIRAFGKALAYAIGVVLTAAKTAAVAAANATATAANNIATAARTRYTTFVSKQLPVLQKAVSDAQASASGAMKDAYAQVAKALADTAAAAEKSALETGVKIAKQTRRVKTAVADITEATGNVSSAALKAAHAKLIAAQAVLADAAKKTGESISASVQENLRVMSEVATGAALAAKTAAQATKEAALVAAAVPGQVQKRIVEKYEDVALAYAARNVRLSSAEKFKKTVEKEVQTLADNEEQVRTLFGTFTTSGWNLDKHDKTVLRTFEPEPNDTLEQYFMETAPAFPLGKEVASRRAILEAGTILSTAEAELEDIKASVTFKELVSKGTSLKPAAKEGDDEFFKANQDALERLAAYETRFGEILSTFDSKMSVALDKLASAGVQAAIAAKQRRAKTTGSLSALVREGRSATEAEEAADIARAEKEEAEAAVAAAKEAAKAAKTEEERAAAETKRRNAEEALEKKRSEQEKAAAEAAAAAAEKAAKDSRNAALEQIYTINEGLRNRKPMTAEIEAALGSNQFLSTVVEEARATVDARRKPLQDEVDRLQEILDDARQPKPTTSARVEADKRIEKTQPLFEKATSELAKFDSKALEDTYTKAKELAGDTLKKPLETYTKRTKGAFGSIFMRQATKEEKPPPPPPAKEIELSSRGPKKQSSIIALNNPGIPNAAAAGPLEVEKEAPTKAEQLGYVKNPLRDKQTPASASTTRVSPLGTGLANRLGNYFNPGISAFKKRKARLGPEKVLGTEDGNKGASPGGKRRTRRKGRNARKSTLKKRRGGK
jgi:hypothetical protein